MKIDRISLYLGRIPLKKAFTTSLFSRSHTESIFVKIESDNGLTGWGETCPNIHILGEPTQSSYLIGQMIAKNLIGQDPADIESIHRQMDLTVFGNSGIKSAFDIACYDILAKSQGLPLYKFLGGENNKPIISDYTISLNDPKEIAEDAKWAIGEGFKILKIKLGKNGSTDVKRIKAIRETIGFDTQLRIDANQGWKIKEAIETLTLLAPYNIQYCEEPINRKNSYRLKKVKNNSPIKIMADECLYDHYDARMLIKENHCDMFNIKLGKSSGLYNAQKIILEAEKHDIPMQIGGFLETRLTFTANCHLALTSDLVKYFDFDSPLFMSHDPIIGGMEYQEEGRILINDAPGLGLSVDEDFLKECEISEFSGS